MTSPWRPKNFPTFSRLNPLALASDVGLRVRRLKCGVRGRNQFSQTTPVRLFSMLSLTQWSSTGVPRNPRVPPVQSRGSARSYTNLILLIKLNAVFCIKQPNYCTGVPRATRMFSWDSAPAKRLKTTGLT